MVKQIIKKENLQQYKDWCENLTKDEEDKISDWALEKKGRCYASYFLTKILKETQPILLSEFKKENNLEKTQELKEHNNNHNNHNSNIKEKYKKYRYNF